MCNLSEAIEERAIERGDYIRLISTVRKKISKNVSAEECAEMLEENLDRVKEIYQLINDNTGLSDQDIFVQCSKNK